MMQEEMVLMIINVSIFNIKMIVVLID